MHQLVQWIRSQADLELNEMTEIGIVIATAMRRDWSRLIEDHSSPLFSEIRYGNGDRGSKSSLEAVSQLPARRRPLNQGRLCCGRRFQDVSQTNALAVCHHYPLRTLALLGGVDTRSPLLAEPEAWGSDRKGAIFFHCSSLSSRL